MEIVLDTDLALGSKRGDVDDGFAVAAALLGGMNVRAVTTVFGNSTERDAYRNAVELVRVCGSSIPVIAGARQRGNSATDAGVYLNSLSGPFLVVALGPLTNVAAVIGNQNCRGVILVGGNTESRGTIPPVWPFEFNLTHDRKAARSLFSSDIALTVVPLNVARTLRVSFEQVLGLGGAIGAHLASHSKRWFNRSRLLYGKRTVPLWDLVPVLSLLQPDSCTIENRSLTLHPRGYLVPSQGRQIGVVSSIDGKRMWGRFSDIMQAE